MSDQDIPLSDDDLTDIRERVAAATPGPWYVRFLDDSHAANLVAVGTRPGNGRNDDWPDFSAADIVAATLVQFPNRYVDCADERWDENAAFIAHARQDVPRLLAEIDRLRAQLGQAPAPETRPAEGRPGARARRGPGRPG